VLVPNLFEQILGLFGKDKSTNPEDAGVLNRFIGSLKGAGSMYGQTEAGAYYTFQWFADLVENPQADPSKDVLRPATDLEKPTPPDPADPSKAGERHANDALILETN
jgi:hypothetical protein